MSECTLTLDVTFPATMAAKLKHRQRWRLLSCRRNSPFPEIVGCDCVGDYYLHCASGLPRLICAINQITQLSVHDESYHWNARTKEGRGTP